MTSQGRSSDSVLRIANVSVSCSPLSLSADRAKLRTCSTQYVMVRVGHNADRLHLNVR